MNITIQAVRDEDGSGRIIITGECTSEAHVDNVLSVCVKTPVLA